ncbi:hypothetical protein HHI36_001398 [Cryptolaemus montrouzieri]|uniref:Uncharacterized protein n=1 Tax=Cryptolaemus montrouzieri TaxID=559131 RepID=A0ABD2P858_9CUCU
MLKDEWDLIERKTLNEAWNRVNLNRENDNSITNTDDSILEDMNEINEQQEMQEDETEENIDVENDTGPSHDVAFHALEAALKWFEKQTESDIVNLLQLKRIRDIAAMKRKSCLRQMKITKYFKPN